MQPQLGIWKRFIRSLSLGHSGADRRAKPLGWQHTGKPLCLLGFAEAERAHLAGSARKAHCRLELGASQQGCADLSMYTDIGNSAYTVVSR